MTAPAGGPADRDRGSKRGSVSNPAAKRPFYPASSASFPGRSGDRGSSTADIAAHDPRSCPGSPGRTRREAGRRELARAMSRYAGVMRDAGGLAALMRIIAIPGSQANGDGGAPVAGGAPPEPSGGSPVAPAREGRAEETGGHVQAPVELAAVERDLAGIGLESAGLELESAGLELAAVEAANLRTVSLLIGAGALRRAESRGCHRRRDAAGTAVAPWHTLARWDGRELVVTGEAL